MEDEDRVSNDPSKPSPMRLPGLDALRGLAIALVMLRHAWPRVFGEAGAVGVVIFFTLSGYLITGILLRDAEIPPGRLLWRFCRNRALRLLPPLLLLLLVFGFVEGTTNRLADRGVLGSSLILGLTYTSDLPLRVHMSPGISHLWTLAVEEQFYLLWPFLIIGARRRLRIALVAMGAVAMCLGALTVAAFPSRGGVVYTLPTTWAVTLVIGAAAYAVRDTRRPSMGSATVPLATVGILLLLCLLPDAKSHAGWFLVLGPAVSLLTVSLIRAAEDWPQRPPGWIAPIRSLGIISYAAYLWNFPIVNWLRGPAMSLSSPWRGAASIPLTIIAAVLSWHLAEKHIARFKRGLDRPQDEPAPMRMPMLAMHSVESLTTTAKAA
jgi:peptidoglycan/LPS O-acetylase OafA/YrhL